MNQLKFHYQCLVLLFIININSGQTCTNSIPDFFYNVNFAGPIFDQAVYTTGFIDVSTPVNTELFEFTIKPQTNYTLPSFISSSTSPRERRVTYENITLTTNDQNFNVLVKNSAAGRYSLVTNTSPLKYFSPYNRYLFKLIARQRISDTRPPVISTAIVQVNLINVNVNLPKFISNNQSFYISETALSGTKIGTIYAIDEDNDTITYSTCDTRFIIDRLTGVLRLNQPFDSSSQSEYSISVTASDDGSICEPFISTNRRSTSTNIRIIVTAVNKYSPQFSNGLCGGVISIEENNDISGVIKEFHVFDNDRDVNRIVNVAFPSKNLRTTVSGWRNTGYSQFYIEQLDQTNTTRTVRLRANESFDYDKPGATKVWYLYLIATDSGTPPRQAFCSLRLNLIDVNDNSPKFIMTNWNITIPRNTTRLSRIIASDADSGVNGLITYAISLNPYFLINERSGAIILRSNAPGPACYNTSHFPITFQVYARDNGVPPRFSENNATVTIYCTDNDELAQGTWLDPRYEELNITITEKFYENHTDHLIFDNNINFNGSIYYSLTSQTSIMTVCSAYLNNKTIPFRDVPVVKEGQLFRSGITVTRGLHAEIQNLYQLYIRVLVNPPLIGTVTIHLKDENDQIPTFDIRSLELSVLRKETNIRSIAQIQAYDRDVDPPNNIVEYRLNENLSDLDVKGLFFVERNGTIWTNSTFDSNNKTFYRVFVTAFDGAQAWNSRINQPNIQDFQLDIRVIGINDNPPSFVNVIEEINVNKTSIDEDYILRLLIIDSDIDTKLSLGIVNGNIKNAFTFTLVSDNSDNSTRTQYEAIGGLKIVNLLDYQSGANYKLILFAFDGKNTVEMNLTINLLPENTKAPEFLLAPNSVYSYTIEENTPVILNGIKAFDPDNPPTNLIYRIFSNNHLLDFSNIELDTSEDYVKIVIKSPGLSRILPYGDSTYQFSIDATDENGFGITSYALVKITVTSKYNRVPVPIPTNGEWIIREGCNSPIDIVFKDYDNSGGDPLQYRIDVLSPPQFKPNCPTVTSNRTCEFVYDGCLNRTLTKNFPVTLNISNENIFTITKISIVVSDTSNTYSITDGSKVIRIIHVNGYEGSLPGVSLGSVHVNDLNDWYLADRTYTKRDEYDANKFDVTNGYVRPLEILNSRFYRILVDVRKRDLPPALSTIHIDVENVDSEYVRQASTVRIRGEYPETLIDSKYGRPPLDKLLDALASLLHVSRNTIKILAIRPVFQYRNPYYPPKSFEDDRNDALTDVIFYIPGSDKFDTEENLKSRLSEFSSRFAINVTDSGPNPCHNYRCPIDTICRPTRTIQPKPMSIDTNQTSFVGINILDSADCVNSADISYDCRIFTFDNSTNPLLKPCENLVRTFDENGGGYVRFNGRTFSNSARTRFSFDFVLQKMITDGLILLYGRNSLPISDSSWIAIEIVNERLKFHFENKIIIATDTVLNALTWYHIECQMVDSTVLVSINDCQYGLETISDTLNTYDPSTFQLYLGGVPQNELVSGLYPSITTLNSNTFNGCIRNVLSNGYYIDMNKALSSVNSVSGECRCEITNSCRAESRSSIIPWYTWLIIALVLLLLATVLAMILLTLIRRRQRLKRLAALCTDDTRDTIIDYKETAGEEDHSTYNLRVLKKPVYIIPGSDKFDYPNPWIHYPQPALGDYIEHKLSEQVLPYSHDTQLHYRYEGEGSITSDLSSIESPPLHNENDYTFLRSLGPKFSRLADLYTNSIDNDDDDDDVDV